MDAISPEQLQAEKPINYDEICRIVGSLYLDSYHRVSAIEEHAKSIIQEYANRIEDLTLENGQLRKSLEDAGKS